MKADDIFFCLCGYLLFFYCVLDVAAALPEYFIEDHCGQTLALNLDTVEAVRLRLTRNDKYPDGVDCAMRVQAPEGKRLQLRFEDFDVHGIPDLQCRSGDYIQVFDGASTLQTAPLEGLPVVVCQSPEHKNYATSGRYLVISFHSDTDMISGRGLKLVVTAFSDGPCSAEQYQCAASGRCIQKSLECDGEVNCFDGSDEAIPKCLSTAAIAGIAVGGGVVLIIIIIVIVVVIVLYRRRKRARIIKRAYSGRGSYPSSFWDDSTQAPHYDTAADTDDVHHGTPDVTLSPVESNLPDLYSSIDKSLKKRPQMEEETVRSPSRTKMPQPPSGFWDIRLSDLQLTPVTDI